MSLTVNPADSNHKSTGAQIHQSILQPHSKIPHITSSMATIQDDDELLLARIGYKQVCTPTALRKLSN